MLKMKLAITSVVIYAAVQCCLGAPTEAEMEAVVQECLTKEHIPDEDLTRLWEGDFDDGASNEIMRFTACLLELFGVASDGVFKDDFIKKCSEHEAPQKCAHIYKSCSADGEGDALEMGLKSFDCLGKEFI